MLIRCRWIKHWSFIIFYRRKIIVQLSKININNKHISLIGIKESLTMIYNVYTTIILYYINLVDLTINQIESYLHKNLGDAFIR